MKKNIWSPFASRYNVLLIFSDKLKDVINMDSVAKSYGYEDHVTWNRKIALKDDIASDEMEEIICSSFLAFIDALQDMEISNLFPTVVGVAEGIGEGIFRLASHMAQASESISPHSVMDVKKQKGKKRNG